MKKILLSFLLFFSCIFAQNNETKFKLLTTADGMPANTILEICQDNLGFLWVGTDNGLTRYDGYNFVYVDQNSIYGSLLRQTVILSLASDKKGNVWIGTSSEGVFKVNADTEKIEKLDLFNDKNKMVLAGEINDLYCDENYLWIATERKGLIKYDYRNNKKLKQLEFVSKADSERNASIYEIKKDNLGNLWIGYENGILKFDLENDIIIDKTQELFPGEDVRKLLINRLCFDHMGDLWMSIWENGLAHYNFKKQKLNKYSAYDKNQTEFKSPRITKIIKSAENIIWISTYGNGLYTYSHKTDKMTQIKHNYSNPNPIASNSLITLFEDNNGLIWIGTLSRGLNIYDKFSGKFNNLKKIPNYKNSFRNDKVWTITKDSKGLFWFGTEEGISIYDKGKNKFQNFIINEKNEAVLQRANVSSILEDSQNNIWIGTYGWGLFFYDRGKKKIKQYLPESKNKNSLSGYLVSCLQEDDDGVIWIGTLNSGVNKFDKKTNTFSRYRSICDDSVTISSNEIIDIYRDKSDQIWISAIHGGLCKYNKERDSFERFYYRSKALDIFSGAYEDKNGRLWLCNYNSGLLEFNKESKTFKSYINEAGDVFNNVKTITGDENGNLWLGTDGGITKFDPETKKFVNYTSSEGVVGGYVNVTASYYDKSDGTIYFGGPEGINFFNPKNISMNLLPPEVVFTKLKISDSEIIPGQKSILTKSISQTKKIQLQYDQNDIIIEFSAMQYSRSNKNKYEYKLTSVIDEWRQIGNSNFISIPNLEPGNYTLIVKAANSDGVWSREGKKLEIIVYPPFYATFWFRIFGVIIIIFIVYLSIRKRIKYLEIKKAELEERVIERTEAANELESALKEVDSLKDRLLAEKSYLQEEIKLDHNFSDLICKSDNLKRILAKVEKVSSTDATVLITGESGTGKELIARSIHNLSLRRDRPLIKVNCAVLPANLIESELFGHEKGAFTGAYASKSGRFELADGGTIFLDEIGEMPVEIQTKLLRVIQEGEFERLGGTKTKKVDVRIIAATNRNLPEEINKGNFREDLFYRLNVFPLELPPLRERKVDIPLLVNHFVDKYGSKLGKKIDKIPEAIIHKLKSYNWPGNIRELENVIERAVIISPENKLTIDDSFFSNSGFENSTNEIKTLKEFEKEQILKALELTNWTVSGEKGAAKLLDINSSTLLSRMKKLGVETPNKRISKN